MSTMNLNKKVVEVVLATLLVGLAASCTGDSGESASSESTSVMQALEAEESERVFPDAVNPVETKYLAGVSNSWVPVSPCKFFSELSGEPSLREVVRIVMTNPGIVDYPNAVSFVELEGERDSEWVAFSGGLLSNRIHVVSASFELEVGDQVFWFQSGEKDQNLDAYWLTGLELMIFEDGHVLAGPGRVALSSGGLSRGEIEGAFLQDVTGFREVGNECDKSWAPEPASRVVVPDDSVEVSQPPLKGGEPNVGPRD